MKKLLGQLIRLDYRLAKLYGVSRLRLQTALTRCQNPVVIHQVGKVGSSTVLKSLKQAAPDLLVYHVHHLTPESVRNEEISYRKAFRQRRRIDNHLLHSLYLLSRIRNGREGINWRVITLVRDPLAINVSAFFQTLPFRMPDFKEKVETLSLKLLSSDIRSLFFEKGWWHHHPLEYFFTRQLKPAFGFDILSVPFPKEQGFFTYKRKKAELLLIRLEDLDRIGAIALSEFLGVEGVYFFRKQVANSKYYAEVYNLVRSILEFPSDYLDRIYESVYTHHFYTRSEIKTFRSAWRTNYSSS